MSALAPLRIDGPLPVAAPYGLVTTPGTIGTEGDPHWNGGVAVEGFAADTPYTHDPCSVGSARVKLEGSAPPLPTFSSFTVYLPVTCGGMGLGNEAGAERLRNRVRLAFQAREGFAVEREFMFGDASSSKPFLADGNGTVMPGAFGPREGLSLIENAIGATAQRGFIHVDPATFTSWSAYGLVEADGATMRTRRGNTVIVGDGYIGGVPDGEAVLEPDEGYAFATGPVVLLRSDQPTVLGPTREALNREDNSVTFFVERNYVAYWDTALQYAVRIDRSDSP